MGYYVDYYLDVSDANTISAEHPSGTDITPAQYEQIAEYLENDEVLNELMPFEFPGLDWEPESIRGDFAKQMEALSKAFPEVLFTLTCEGEDNHNWTEYWLNGLCQSVDHAPPPFDRTKLEEHPWTDDDE